MAVVWRELHRCFDMGEVWSRALVEYLIAQAARLFFHLRILSPSCSPA